MKVFFSETVFVFLLLFGMNIHSAESIKLDHSVGVPRILVDGSPVRAHMVYVNPGFRNLIFEPTGRMLSFDFSPENDEDAVGLQVRFGMREGSFVLDDIHLIEVETGRELIPKITFDQNGIDDLKAGPLYLRPWELYGTSGEWNIATGEGVDGSHSLKITIKRPQEGKWPFFHLGSNFTFSMKKDKTYRMSFYGKADQPRPISIAFLVKDKQFSRIDGYGSILRREVELAADAGVNFVQTEIELPWPKPGETPDWEDTDYICSTIIKANPNALIFPRIYIEAPEWWLKENPDDVMTGEKPFPMHYEVPGKISLISNFGASVASTKFQTDVCKNLKVLVEHLESKFGANIGGYYPAGQNTNEWFYKGMWPGVLNGYSASDLEAWRRWLGRRYPDDKALQDAWGMQNVTRTGAAVPTPEERRANPGGQFHDLRFNPKASMLIDYNQYQQEVLADCIITFCETVREASKGKRLILVCYGYFFELGAVPAGPGTSGHYGLRKLLASKAIDLVGGPFSYHDRSPGDPGPMMSVVESIGLAGKIWFNEDDTRTYLVTQQNFPGSESGANTQEGTIQLLRRNTVQCAMRYCGSWWTDLPSAGWFDDPKLWTVMKELDGIGFDLLKNPRPYRPEIGAYMDEASMLTVAAGGHLVNWHAVRAVRTPLGKVGAPYGQYLVDDLLAGKTTTKLNVMLTSWCLTAEQRTALKKATRGKTNLWCYAPGYLDGRNGSSLEAMKDLTGLTYKKIEQVVSMAKPTALGESLGLTQTFGLNLRNANPLLAVTDAKPKEILATYPDGSAAIVLRKESDGTKTLFCGVPGLSTELLRLAAKEVGVHLYTQTDCVVYANGPYAYFYGVEDGTVEVDLNESGTILDLQSDETLGTGSKVKLSLKKGEGRILTVKKENTVTVISDGWKLVFDLYEKPEFFIHLTNDLKESKNLIAVPEHKDQQEKLQQIFRSIRSSERSTKPLEIR